ncbi:MAG: DUF4344 domain-containing metallopeptidase [Desulfobacterales bacterium]|jgi:uncharacterized membrane protein YgcG
MRKGYILIFGLIAIISLSLPVSAANPRVLITKPDDGATGVPINVGEISIFFSEPMDTKTWSILQIIDHEFPPVMSMEPPWKDEQTFILKLGKLKPGTKYGLQLNSGTKKGFKSAKGTALTPMPIRFETTGQTGGEDTGGGQDERTEPAEKKPDKKPMTDQERIALHITGGTLGIFFHEFGHGLIDMYKLPVTGREEDVVDEFSTMLLLYAREEGADYMPEVVWGFADLWRLMGKHGGKTPWWDEHTDSMVRFGNVLCLLYGSSPKEFQGLMDKYMKNQDRRQYFCRQEYPEKQAAWNTLLKDHLTENGGQPKGKVTVVYGETKTEFGRQFEQTIKEEQVFEQLADGISKGFILPYDIQIVPKDCGEPNAYWDPQNHQIIMCHEMIKLYIDLMEKEYSGGGGTGGSGGGETGGSGGGGTGGSGGGGQEASNDQRIFGRWGGRMDNRGITYTWGLSLTNNGRYEFLHEQWRMGQRYYWEDQSGAYSAHNNTITFMPQDGSQVGGRTSYNYTVQGNMLTIKRVPTLQGGDMVFHKLQ